MAESILSIVAEAIITKLGSAAFRQLGVARGATQEMENLQGTLRTIKAVLVNAEAQEGKNPQLQEWLRRIKLVFDKADDVVDEYQIVALQHQVMRERLGTTVRCFCSSSNPLMFRNRMGRAIKSIREDLDAIAIDKHDFPIPEMGNTHRNSPATTPYLGNLQVFGRVEDKQKILDQLMESQEDENIRVVPIFGIGGMGKTTLARLVYNDESFNNDSSLVKGWVHVSNGCDVSSIARKIITALVGVSCDGWAEGQLHDILSGLLDNKMFLLVLDDVWGINKAEWEELRNLLMAGGKGGKIIVTTRHISVASVVHTLPIHSLKGLKEEDSVSLFVRWVLQEGEQRLPNDLMTTGEEIVRKCKGIPLAIKTLGRLLNLERDRNRWLTIKNKEMWRMVQDRDDILPVLRFSYDHLPSQLKPCFALLCTFAKDTVIMSTTLVCRWIALGFIQPTNENDDLEKIGIGYINELFGRSFIEIHHSGYYLLIRMHDLMHDLALLVAQEEHAVVSRNVKDARQDLRHLTFCDRDPSPGEIFPECFKKLKNVHTVAHLGATKPDSSFLDTCVARYKLLRVLYLPNSSFDSLPKRVRDLRHLRLLDLSFNTNIKYLPDSLCELQGLQTLSLFRCSELRTLPKDFGMLISLRFLHLTTQDRCLSGKSFEKLTMLRHLYISECFNLRRLFDEIGTPDILASLLSLGIYDCQNLSCLPQEFGYLKALESLAITGCKKLDLMANVQGNGNLRSLQYLGIADLQTMVSLPQWIIQSAAATLSQLVIVGCFNVTSLPENLTLRKLWIENCPQLKSLSAGVDRRTTLQEIVVVNCPELVRSCQPNTGDGWPNISSVAEVHLDGINVKTNASSGNKKWFESTSFLLKLEHVKDLEVAFS